MALVCRVDRGAYDVLTEDGPRRVRALPRGVVATVGDRVVLDDDRAVALEPRTSLLARGASSGHAVAQPLAANVDVVLLCFGLHVPVPSRRLAELLVIAWDSGARPVVVLTKTDLCADLELVRDEVAAQAPGAPVVAVSATRSELHELTPHVRGTLVLLGASGAGKSTLLNALAGEDVMLTGAVRATDGEGRHTTTHRELFVLPSGAVVIDTPGLREVAVRAGSLAVEQTFGDVTAVAELCRFADCGHGGEPGCAVAAALADGSLTQSRLADWQHVAREAAYQARRSDVRLRQEERAVWKRRTRERRQRL